MVLSALSVTHRTPNAVKSMAAGPDTDTHPAYFSSKIPADLGKVTSVCGSVPDQ